MPATKEQLAKYIADSKAKKKAKQASGGGKPKFDFSKVTQESTGSPF